MRTETPQKVLEKLATSDKVTIVIERQSDGKMRVTSGSWDREKLILRDQVVEVRPSSTAARRGSRGPQARRGTPQAAPYDPTGRAPMSSLMTESLLDRRSRVTRHCPTVIDHAGPVSDHANPVIDHKVLTEAISRTKRTSNSRRPCPLSADITSSEGSKPQERAGLRWHLFETAVSFGGRPSGYPIPRHPWPLSS
jgi:hypothetical protein